MLGAGGSRPSTRTIGSRGRGGGGGVRGGRRGQGIGRGTAADGSCGGGLGREEMGVGRRKEGVRAGVRRGHTPRGGHAASVAAAAGNESKNMAHSIGQTNKSTTELRAPPACERKDGTLRATNT